MRRVDDGKENVFNRGDPAGGSISHSNNELQEVSRGHSSDESWENPEGAKARTVNCWSKNLIVICAVSISREGWKHRMRAYHEKDGETTHAATKPIGRNLGEG